MGLEQKSKELAEEIKLSKEYIELKQSKSYIDKDIVLKSKIDDFKKKEHDLYSAKLSMQDINIKTAELGKLFDSFSKVPEINRFLKAEKDFNNLMLKVYGTINTIIESGIKST